MLVFLCGEPGAGLSPASGSWEQGEGRPGGAPVGDGGLVDRPRWQVSPATGEEVVPLRLQGPPESAPSWVISAPASQPRTGSSPSTGFFSLPTHPRLPGREPEHGKGSGFGSHTPWGHTGQGEAGGP